MGWYDGNSRKTRISGLPSWVLTPAEEKQVLEEYQKEVWRKCDEYVKEFQKCEASAGFGVWFKCKEEGKAMKACVEHHHQYEYVDEIRDAFIKKKMKRAQEVAQSEDK
ncbi:COX assembly mitochondrial protein [Pichia kudriavzevii]|uniref:COX assembly mitochondrial protein n=1 Tax=Pichia kudriavzevii TaxID=4909 RepID=A0A1V2LSS5_PICKU|nr:COX assembly mitochondrial protein [Pichia kudriavzevii]